MNQLLQINETFASNSIIHFIHYIYIHPNIIFGNIFLTQLKCAHLQRFVFNSQDKISMDKQLNQAFYLVSQPNSATIKEGEHLLASLQKQNHYPSALLNYMNNQSINQEGKLRAAIELKIWCQNYKDFEEFEKSYYAQYIQDIKVSIIQAFLNFPLKISKTLRPGIVCLADVSYPDKWPNLIEGLIHSANENNGYIVAVLKLIQSISKKYTYLSRSDILYHEIITMCDSVHDFLLSLTMKMLTNLQSSRNETIGVLQILMKIFYNLNYQDLHPKFEDNLGNWMQILKHIMSLNNTDEVVYNCKGAALQSILLYASKYKEDVEGPIKGFCEEIWKLCSNANQDAQYEHVVFSSLKFFKSLLLWSDMKTFFSENTEELMTNLILPNIQMNKNTLALFEQEISVFTDYYFKNAELQTGRAAALELLRVLCRHYNTFEQFLKRQILNFQNSEKREIKTEVQILNLVIDGGSKGYRDVDGCTSLFIGEDIVRHCYDSIVKKSLAQMYKESLSPNVLLDKKFDLMHIVTCIRFIYYFRIFIPSEELSGILTFLATIRTNHESLRTVIQMAIDAFLNVKHGDYVMYKNFISYFNPQNLGPLASDILKLIYSYTNNTHPLNQSLTKLFYTTIKALSTLNPSFFQYSTEIIKIMLSKTTQFDFASVHFLFEAIGNLAYWLIKTDDPSKAILEKQIFDFFSIALKNQSDLMNFCLQIMSIYLLQWNSNPQYDLIYESILDAVNWREENLSIMPSYIQYISAYVAKNKPKLIENRTSFEVILTKIIELEHFQLFYRFLDSIIKNVTIDQFYASGYLTLAVKGSEVIVNSSIQARKSTLIFISKLIISNDSNKVLGYINNVVPNFFQTILLQSAEIIQSLQFRRDRKFLFIAICNSLKNQYFSNQEVEANLFNLMIENTTFKFNFSRIVENNQETERKEKKEANYKKLAIFKEIEPVENEAIFDEEVELVRTYLWCCEKNGNLQGMITQKNNERLLKLHQKYSNNS